MRFVALAILFLCSACSQAAKYREAYLVPYHAGNLPIAEANVTSVIAKEIPSHDYRQSSDAAWLYLDRGTIAFATGDTATAVSDYQFALEALDYYSQECAAEAVGKVMLQDELGAYAGEDFEQVLARVYFAFALIHKGDLNNARAMLRQAEEWQQKQRERYSTSPITADYHLVDNALAKYLLALVLEKQGDRSNSAILFQQAAELASVEASESEILSLIQPSSNSKATVLVVCHNGNAPYKISGITDASVASTVALEIFLSGQCHDFAVSSLGGIPTPCLAYWPGSDPLLTTASVNGCVKDLASWYNVGTTAEMQLNQKIPTIVARGAARYLLRRGTVAYVSERDPNLGCFVDIAMLIANLNTKADTRSWSTLPEFIDLARFDLDPGTHHITITVEQPSGQQSQQSYDLKLRPNDLCLIHVFNIHPGVTSIQVPSRFLSNPGEPL